MPLADRIRPSTLDEVVGQRHILAQGKPLYNIISRGKIPNMIFYGPSGVGKTTVANIIAQKTSMSLYRLNGTQASTSDIKDVVANLGTFGAAEFCYSLTRYNISIKSSSRHCSNISRAEK